MPNAGFVPPWQRSVIALSTTFVFAIIVLALFFARSIFIPIALAVFFTFVLTPMVIRLQHRGLGRIGSVAVVVTASVLLSVGTGVVLAQQVANLSDEITQPERAEAFKAKIARSKESMNRDGGNHLGRLIQDVSGILLPNPTSGEPVPVTMQPDSSAILGRMEAYLAPTAQILAQAAFTFILTIFMLLRREDLRNRMIRLTGHGKVTTTTKALDDGSRRISSYLLAQLIVNACFGLLIAIGLKVVGLKLVLLWGAIAFLMRYIPYLGAWIGLLPPTLFSLVMSDGWAQPIAVLAIFVVLEAIVSNFVEPLVYGRSMGISEVAQLVAAAFWAFLWGPIGLILAGPLTACLLVLGKHVSRFEYFSILLGDEPVLAPDVMFYQRLTARDQDEASELAHQALDEKGALAVYDAIIVPALCLAKRDHKDGDFSSEVLSQMVNAAREVADELVVSQPVEPTVTDRRVRILLCPARDEADHVAVELLASTLDHGRWEVQVAATDMLASELLTRIETYRPSALIVGSLPPGEMSHTRYLVTRVRSKFPDLKLIVGRWGRGGDFLAETTAAERTGADWMDSTMVETHKRLADWFAVFSAQDSEGQERPWNPNAIGTPNASLTSV